MAIIGFLISLAGATMLLLFAVRMVRTGIERSFGAAFRRVITGPQGRLRAAASGLGLAVVLQSSAAVALWWPASPPAGRWALPPAWPRCSAAIWARR